MRGLQRYAARCSGTQTVGRFFLCVLTRPPGRVIPNQIWTAQTARPFYSRKRPAPAACPEERLEERPQQKKMQVSSPPRVPIGRIDSRNGLVLLLYWRIQFKWPLFIFIIAVLLSHATSFNLTHDYKSHCVSWVCVCVGVCRQFHTQTVSCKNT